MQLSRRNFVRMAGGVATALTTLPLNAEILKSYEAAQELAPTSPIHLDSNENPYGPSPKALEAMLKAVAMGNRYPFRDYAGISQRIAAFHNVRPEQVLLGCGSSEILRVASVALLGPGKKFMQAAPTFETAEKYAKLAGAEVISVPVDRNFAHDLDKMLAQIDTNTPLVYICNPNNPTGSLTSRDALETFISKVPPTTTVLIDEAYHHFTLQAPTYSSFIDHPMNDDRVLVSRTFSKVYGLAGMRLGYAIGAPKLIARLHPFITPINLNRAVVDGGLAALEDTEYVQDCIGRNEAVRKEFFAQAAQRNLKPIPSYTNFVMMGVGRPAKQVIAHFKKNNVWIGREFPPLNTYIRVSLGKPEEMTAFWRVYDLQAS